MIAVWHIHHDKLVEWTDNLQERIDYIEAEKPPSGIETRLRLIHPIRVLPAVIDIITWLPKVRPGGFIGGHDYTTKQYSEVIPAVRYTLGEPDMVFEDSSWVKRVPFIKEAMETV